MELDPIIATLEAQGFAHLASSHCWDYPKAKLDSIRAKVVRDARAIPNVSCVIVVVGAVVGRTHARTELHLFDGSNLNSRQLDACSRDWWTIKK